MLVAFSGLPGIGKSTLADEVGDRLRIPVFSVDPLESAILSAKIARSFETGLAAYLVAHALADAQLGLGQSAIIDAVNGVEWAKSTLRALAAKYSVPLRVIECSCSDAALHERRLADRRRGLATSFVEPTWEEIERRRREWTPWTEPVLAVDAVAPLAENVERVMAWITA